MRYPLNEARLKGRGVHLPWPNTRLRQHCRIPNPPENRFCGHCAASMQEGSTPTPEYSTGQHTARPEVFPARKTVESGRLRAILGDVSKPLAFGALVVLAEAGMMWLGHWAGGHSNALPSSNEPTDNVLASSVLST